MNKKYLKIILPKRLFDFIYEIFYVKLYRIFHGFDHEYKPDFNSVFPNIKFSKINFFDLQDGLEIDTNNFKKNSLISYVLKKNYYLKGKNFLFESWVAHNNKTYTDNDTFLITHKRKIYNALKSKKIKNYNKKIFLLPYYINQAGHFMGENLGAILFFLELLKKRNRKEKLLIITPSKNWNNFFKKNYKNNIVIFNEKYLIDNNIIFTKSQVFPKFSIYQNYIMAKNILSEKIENNDYSKKKLFLFSGREDRIVNSKDVIKFLKKRNFQILNPTKVSILKLFKILNSAKIVISESASISHNIHLARNKKYYLLLSKKDKNINPKWQRLTTIYNNFHVNLYRPIFCENYSDPNSKIPLQSQIKVDLKKLKNL